MEQTLKDHIFMKMLLKQYLNIKQEEFEKQKAEMYQKLNLAKVYGKIGMRSIYNPIQLADKSFEKDSSNINNQLNQIEKHIIALKKIALTGTTLQEVRQEIYAFYITKLLVRCSSIIEYVANYLLENNKFPIEVTRPNENGIDKEQINKINNLETISEEEKIYYSALLPYIKQTSKTKSMI